MIDTVVASFGIMQPVTYLSVFLRKMKNSLLIVLSVLVGDITVAICIWLLLLL